MDRLVQTQLADIANNLEIKDGLTILHPHYRSIDLPLELKTRLKCLSPELQEKYLSGQLRDFLYAVYYNGSWKSNLAVIDPSPEQLTQPRNLPDWENNTFLGMDAQFYDQIDRANCGGGFYDPGWQIISEEDDGILKISKYELSLYIDRAYYLQPSEHHALVGSIVSVKMPHNLIQNGFYIAVSNAGGLDRSLAVVDSSIVRVYFNITADGAIALMSAMTTGLNLAKVPFHFKVLYNPTDYNRYDPGVLYIQRGHYPTVHLLLQNIYPQYQQYFRSQIPLFTKQIAPGLAIAEEPDRKFGESESFGLNRCQIVANALIEVSKQNCANPQAKLTAIFSGFQKMGISLEYPFLNANSVDIYSALELI
jgi:HopA1 effector protein family